MEIGPYRLKDKDTLVANNGSWNEFANLLFVDNPVGTGFSYANTDSYVHELTEMATQFVQFLEKFFAIFPEYSRDDVSALADLGASRELTSARFTLPESLMLDSISPTLRERYSTATPRDPINGVCKAYCSETHGCLPASSMTLT